MTLYIIDEKVFWDPLSQHIGWRSTGEAPIGAPLWAWGTYLLPTISDSWHIYIYNWLICHQLCHKMSQKLPKRGYFPVRRAVTVSMPYTDVYVTGHTGHDRIRRVRGKSSTVRLRWPYTVTYGYGCRPLSTSAASNDLTVNRPPGFHPKSPPMGHLLEWML